jgi:hypothetical protein
VDDRCSGGRISRQELKAFFQEREKDGSRRGGMFHGHDFGSSNILILPNGARMNQRRCTEEILNPCFVPFIRKCVKV